MKFKRRFKIEIGRLDMTPLINIVLLLLIFFVFSSNFISQQGINVDLPKVGLSAINGTGDIIIILTADDKIYFNNEPTTFDGLGRRIKRLYSKNPDASIIIKADSTSKHGSLIKVMNIVQKSGIKKIAIAAEPEKN
jgi:biopolymer transport protein ExbD